MITSFGDMLMMKLEDLFNAKFMSSQESWAKAVLSLQLVLIIGRRENLESRKRVVSYCRGFGGSRFR